MDSDNFHYSLIADTGTEFKVSMSQGVMVVDNVEFEDNDDDPTYAFAREVAKLRGLIK